jgi:hypothetical protein
VYNFTKLSHKLLTIRLKELGEKKNLGGILTLVWNEDSVDLRNVSKWPRRLNAVTSCSTVVDGCFALLDSSVGIEFFTKSFNRCACTLFYVLLILPLTSTEGPRTLPLRSGNVPATIDQIDFMGFKTKSFVGSWEAKDEI